MKELKKRFGVFLWGVLYVILAMGVDFALGNLGLLNIPAVYVPFLAMFLKELGKYLRKQILSLKQA